MGVVTQFYPDDSKIIKWKAYYWDDVSEAVVIYDSDSIAWEDLPQVGVLVFVRYYRMADGRVDIQKWNGGDIYTGTRSIEDIIATDPQIGKYIKLGVYLPDVVYHPVYDSIILDIENSKPAKV